MQMKGLFTQIDNEILRSGVLRPHDLAVYANLKSRQGNKKSAWPSLGRIAKETSMSVSGAKIAIKRLVDFGLIAVKGQLGKDGKRITNSYKVLPYKAGHLVTLSESLSDHKEDSSQEDSNTNSSAKLSKRVWSHLDPSKPATDKQITYLRSFIEKNGQPEDLFPWTEPIDLASLSQVEANEWIEKFFILEYRDERYA